MPSVLVYQRKRSYRLPIQMSIQPALKGQERTPYAHSTTGVVVGSPRTSQQKYSEIYY